MQDLICAEELLAPDGGQPRQLIRYPWDQPVTAEPLVGELDTHTGHGTFIAGLLRQIEPDAQVLSVRIMHSDGIVYEYDLIYALALLADRVAAAEAGDMTQMVDVLSLSLGYFSETRADKAYTSWLWTVIDRLLNLGVVITAAAGNYATSREFYPAALAPLATEPPLISVGALNPNGSRALFSDGGWWIKCWASGAGMISTFPADINGRREPEISMPAHPANTVPDGVHLPGERAALDPDNYTGGYAVWSGTSFSAPVVAAHIARELLAGAAADPGLLLSIGGKDPAVNRVRHALKSLGWPG
jgi:subtilisin family serine protease